MGSGIPLYEFFDINCLLLSTLSPLFYPVVLPTLSHTLRAVLAQVFPQRVDIFVQAYLIVSKCHDSTAQDPRMKDVGMYL